MDMASVYCVDQSQCMTYYNHQQTVHLASQDLLQTDTNRNATE